VTRSELFGHVKGAFTGANKDKPGLIEKAEGGLLILEEIGELPLEAQAMLLTFIETGEYRRVGDDTTRKAKVKIVGATNRETALRDDFRYRFFPFYIPPLRERKQDALYYFHGIFPRLVSTLNRSEILVLLTHHWPGNVREVERVGRLLLRRRWKSGAPDITIGPETTDPAAIPAQARTYSDYGLYHLDPRDSPFDPDALINLNDRLRAHLADIALLEKLLNRHRVSIDDQSPTLAFQEMAGGDVEFCFFTEGYDNIKFCNDFPLFEEAFQGYLAFCGLFSQDPANGENILASLRKCNIEYFSLKQLDYPKRDEAKVHKLATAVMAYLKDFDAEDLGLPKEPRAFWNAISQLKEESETEDAYRNFENDEFMDLVCGMRERELLKNYYLGLLKKTAGNVRMGAKNAGVLETTFRSKLDKLGIRYKRTDNVSR
jgi:transcriptional regulator with AAA-type ATPase domain